MKNKGFTLVEIIVVVAIVTVLTVVVSVSFSKFRKQQALQNTTNAITSILNEARTKTLSAYGNTYHSVKFESNRVVLFVGGTYDSGVVTNESYYYETPAIVSYSLQGGGSQISFDRLKGTTSQYGTITVSISGIGSYTITVSSVGAIVRS